MWTQTPEGRETIAALSKQLVTQTAPEELDLFDELIAEHFNDPQPPAPAAAEDDALGFGLTGSLVAITPAAGAIITTVAAYVLTEVIKTTQQESAKALSKKIKDYFNPQKKDTSLSADQLQAVHKLALKQGKAFGLDSKQAKKMADALAGSLAISG